MAHQLPACPGHPTVRAIVACTSCGRPMCDVCYGHRLDGRPTCATCAYEQATRLQRSISFGISFVGLGWGLLYWLHRTHRFALLTSELGALGALIAVVGVTLAWFIRQGKSVEIEIRDRGEEVEEEFSAPVRNPYRQRARHLAMRATPRVSGSVAAAAVGGSLLLVSAAFPAALHLPRWVEIEVVFAAWWVVFTVGLAILLYRGYRLKDDLVYVSPWDLWRRKQSDKSGAGGLGIGCPDGCGCSPDDAEGVLIVVVVVIVALLLAGAAWILAEIAIPLVLFAAYSLLLRTLRAVAHDKHGCSGELLKSIGWGGLWAALFVGPLAGIVYLVRGVVH